MELSRAPDRPAASGAPSEPREEIRRFTVEGRGSADESTGRDPRQPLPVLGHAGAHLIPHVVRNNPQVGSQEAQAVGFGASALPPGPATGDLLGPIPDHDATVELAVQDLANGAGRPAVVRAIASRRRRHAPRSGAWRCG